MENSLKQGKKTLLLAGAVFIGLNIYWDNFYQRFGITLLNRSLFFQYWIYHIAFAGYLLSCGIILYFMLTFRQYGIITYLMPVKVFRKALQVVVGFCLPMIILPFWLSVRQGTIECFISRDCKNLFGMLYLAVIDVICETQTSTIPPIIAKYEPNTLPKCENISYMIPIMIVTLIPITSVFYLYKAYYIPKLMNSPLLATDTEGPPPLQLLSKIEIMEIEHSEMDISSKSKDRHGLGHRTRRALENIKITAEGSQSESELPITNTIS